MPAHGLRVSDPAVPGATAGALLATLALLALAASPLPAANIFFDSFEVGST